MKIKCFLVLLSMLITSSAIAQTGTLNGTVFSGGENIPFVSIQLKKLSKGMQADENGFFEFKNLPVGEYEVMASFVGYETTYTTVFINSGTVTNVQLQMKSSNAMDEIVVSGTLKPVSRLDSPVNVEVYSPTFFKRNPTPNIFEALQNVNGVRPQLNCNVCNTGDIHINGLEGPYTLVLIDGMPIVSSLATVYGLSGIPNSLIERIEIVKGPASSLYGSEAVGGLINIITKDASKAPAFSADIMGTTWAEFNVDLGFKANIGKSSVLTGLNYYNYNTPIDNNDDNFTDVTLQDRVSLFQKWNVYRPSNKAMSFAGRLFYEDRWGGEMQWNSDYRGGDEVYGESIYTKRWELLGNYELPFTEKFLFQFSYTDHDQNSVYGDTFYLARQKIAFGQLTWDKKIGKHDLLVGAAIRNTYYDDDTPATEDNGVNDPDTSTIPSVFVQDEITLNENHKLLLGSRYDYNEDHGAIFTPRLAYKWTINKGQVFRVNAGTGFRVVNLFTEEHAALTGAREVEILEDLKPEQSYNVNLNYINKFNLSKGFLTLDASTWYTYFTNIILPDYDTDPNKIIYDNLDGHAVSKGISLNLDATFESGLKVLVGATLMDVTKEDNGIKERQILTENFTGTWSVSYPIHAWDLSVDYTGNIYGPMDLPLLGPLDPRGATSPFWSIQNIQFTYKGINNIEIYAGVKNLLNWTPNKGNPFLIARANDPFDNDVVFDTQGNAVPTTDNPYGLTFDPSYVYAPNQGIRGFLGLRYTIR